MSKDEHPRDKHELQQIAQILHGQHQKVNNISRGLESLGEDQTAQENEINELLAQAKGLLDKAGLEAPGPSPNKDLVADTPHPAPPVTWQGLTDEYCAVGNHYVSLDDLLPPERLAQIGRKFDAPLRREPWDHWDALVIFAAVVVGTISDWFCAPINNPLSKQILSYGHELHDQGGIEKSFQAFQNQLGSSGLVERFPWIEHIANMKVSHDNLPIDYHGSGFGGPYHRVLSGGHDLLRFLSGIWQIKHGQFLGIRYDHGKAIMEVISSQAGGKAYLPTDWQTAAIEYLLHVVADFFTETSLPIPGSTLLREVPNRDLRKLIVDGYQGGYNLRHVIGQSVTPAVTSLIVWLYYTIRYRIGNWVERHLQGRSIPEEAVPGLKLTEMLATAHSFVTGINLGKVLITGNPLMLNLPEILVCVKSLFDLTLKSLRRYSLRARYERNKLYLEEGWSSIEVLMNNLPANELAWPQKPILLLPSATKLE